MKKLSMREGSRALVIVAHPDDETIWMGGTILNNPQVKWAIFSLCRASDSDRSPKFFKVCEQLKAEAIMDDFEDEGLMSSEESIPMIEEILQAKLGAKNYDYIFTHGSNGEYGHARHIGVHQAVKNLFGQKKLKAGELLFFNYQKKQDKEFSPLKEKDDSTYLAELSKEEFEAKKSIMVNTYGFDSKGIDVAYCTNPEAFVSNKAR